MQIRQQKYLNNIVEQDPRFIKKRIRSMLGLKTFGTAKQIICGVEVMHMFKKGQLPQRVKSVKSEIEFIHRLFDVVSLFTDIKGNEVLCFYKIIFAPELVVTNLFLFVNENDEGTFTVTGADTKVTPVVSKTCISTLNSIGSYIVLSTINAKTVTGTIYNERQLQDKAVTISFELKHTVQLTVTPEGTNLSAVPSGRCLGGRD